MSIFSALSLDDWRMVIEQAKHSPQVLAVLLIIGVIMALALGIVVMWTVRHIGGFYAHIQQEEDEDAREEEEEAAQEDTAPESQEESQSSQSP